MEKKVYLVDFRLVDVDIKVGTVDNLTAEAIRQGSVFTLDEFVVAFNSDYINQGESQIVIM